MTASHPNGASYVNAYVTLEDVDAGMEFYKSAFGFYNIEKFPDDSGVTAHAEAKHQGQLIMFGRAGAYGGTTHSPKKSGTESPISLYLYVKDVDQFYQHALKNGAISVLEPQDMFWGDRMCNLKDPEGYQWSIATHKPN